ncbi:MAG: tRNA uracil 4-sulfurtransferase ThiI [Gammaproteobacteria bacterium]
MSFQPNRIAIHYAELALKGRNRAEFEARLGREVRARVQQLGLDWTVVRRGGRMAIKPTGNPERIPAVLETLAEVPGIAIYFPAQLFTHDAAGTDTARLQTGPVMDALITLARETHRPGARFSVRVARHGDAPHRISTQTLERNLGTAILERTPWDGVNLGAPDCCFRLDFQAEGVLLSAERRPGLGGIPVGSSGRVLTLLSGGIDSPVAAFLMARRGCRVHCLHFSANYLDRDQAIDSPIGRLAQRLSCYTRSLQLSVVPYVPFDLALSGARTGYELVLFRRFMLRVAERIARQRHITALVTGDSLSQVASQTLENITALDAAVALPVFRPLIGFNKQEIIAWARRIGTYETSIEPYKDCCALISRGPKTRARAERLEAIEVERIADYGKLIDTVLEETATLHFELGAQIRPAL